MTARPPFDPELEAALLAHRELVVTSLSPDEIETLRRRASPPDAAALTGDGEFVMSVHRAPGLAGAPDVTIVLLRPTSIPGPVPLIYHLHGGGLVTGTAYDDVPPVLQLAAQTGCAVASAEYRLAPEAPYPAAVEDSYAGLVWLADTAAKLGIDPEHVVVEGVSAGGGLAAATALLARDRGGPRLAGQMLICPMLDDRNDSASAIQMAGHGAWDRSANATAWGAYLPDRAGGPDVPICAAPARATDLSGLPPTFIDVGSAETFRDESVAYATRLWLCGGKAELHVWPGGFHGFDFLAPEAAMSQDARAARARWLTRLLVRAGDRRARAHDLASALPGRTGGIVTVEEALTSGLGGAVAEVVVRYHPVPMRFVGVPDTFAPTGSVDWLLDHFGITRTGVATAAREVCARRHARCCQPPVPAAAVRTIRSAVP